MAWPFQKRAGYTRLTRVGFGYVVILVLVILAAWNTGTNLLYLISGGLASFVTLSWIASFSLLRGLILHRSAPKAVYRGQDFQVHIRIENHRRYLPGLSLRLARQSGKNGVGGFIQYLPAGQAARMSLEERFDNRGEQNIDSYYVVSGFPFGLFERCREFQDDLSVLVYPRVYSVRSTLLRRIPGSSQLNARPSEDGDEYYGLREYVPGDDIRRIVWRISARLDKWIVRELGQFRSRLVVLALDSTYKPEIDDFRERFEEAVELTASVALMLLRRRNEVSIMTPKGFLEGGDGKGHERRVLELLARVDASDSPTDFGAEIAAADSAGAAVFLISPNPRDWGGQIQHIRVLDPRELVHG